jgi:hypothetical protein
MNGKIGSNDVGSNDVDKALLVASTTSPKKNISDIASNDIVSNDVDKDKTKPKKNSSIVRGDIIGSDIGSNDVLCGRGGVTNAHVGNKKFRILVAEHQQEYLEMMKKDKASIARRIVARIKESGGRFLKRDDATGDWVKYPMRNAVEKTSQALREGLDIKNRTVRRGNSKSARRDSETTEEIPSKKARLVEGEQQQEKNAIKPMNHQVHAQMLQQERIMQAWRAGNRQQEQIHQAWRAGQQEQMQAWRIGARQQEQIMQAWRVGTAHRLSGL